MKNSKSDSRVPFRMLRRSLRVLRDPLFPLYFLERNLNVLGTENGFRREPQRGRTARVLAVIFQRLRWFQELLQEGRGAPGRDPGCAPALRGLDDGPDRSRIESYCDHCGLCCEICSGFPDFPDPHNPPDAWRFVFGQGLGDGHRFCPFLMHDRRSRRSFCAIHAYRPNPCRIFEEDECRTVKNELKDELRRTGGRPPRSSAALGRLLARCLKRGRGVRLLPHKE
ncbi:MAG: hypothetical protein WHS86_00130 [Desulfosoma sp.]